MYLEEGVRVIVVYLQILQRFRDNMGDLLEKLLRLADLVLVYNEILNARELRKGQKLVDLLNLVLRNV